MKILFDYQIFSMQKYGGISRYYIELMLEYRRMNQKFDLPIYYSNNVYISNIKNIKNYSNSRVLNKIVSIFNNYISKKYINRGQYDIFHPTYYNPYFTKNLTIPYVLTIYDFTHEKFNDVSNRKDRTIQWKRETALGASRIIAISENTKKDIIKYYGIDERKIDVVYLASSLEKILDHPSVDVPGKYLLYVGNRGGYKNFKTFIEAITPLLKEDKKLFIVCAGGGMFNNEELENIEQLRIKDRVVHFDINDDVLSFLFQKALLFVFPSLYEGFGIPVLEAMNCGCPTALSNTSSLPEIGGDASEYFDPRSKHSIYTTIRNTINDKNRLNELIYLGELQRRKFSWKKTAENTIKVYQKAI